MILIDDATATLQGPARTPATAPAPRLRGRQGAHRRDRLHLRGLAARALHLLRQPQLPLPRPRAPPRPLLAADLEGAGQDRHPPALGRGCRAVPRVDRKPPPAGRPPGPHARPLPPSRRADPRQPRSSLPRPPAPPPQPGGADPPEPRPSLPRPPAPPPQPPLSQLEVHQTRGYPVIPGFCAP